MSEEERAYLAAVRMANMSFNLKQKDDPPTLSEWRHYRRLFAENQAEWDAVAQSLLELIRGGSTAASSADTGS